jgi:hypothetical protein
MNAALQTCITAPPDDSQGGESRPANGCNDKNPRESRLESEMSLQRASLTLRAIRQRCETGHNAHSGSRFYSVAVAVDYGDMAWITAAIEAVEKALAGRASGV